MSKSQEAHCAERREAWVGQGARLEIIATPMPDGMWSLSIRNERGVTSTWYEFFATAESAIEVARKVLEEEGVEEFVSTEGFEYLDEEPFVH